MPGSSTSACSTTPMPLRTMRRLPSAPAPLHVTTCGAARRQAGRAGAGSTSAGGDGSGGQHSTLLFRARSRPAPRSRHAARLALPLPLQVDDAKVDDGAQVGLGVQHLVGA